MESATSDKVTPGAATAPYARKATGLVREIPFVDMVAFNASSTSPIPLALAVTVFVALVSFPRANIVLSFLIALFLSVFVWVCFALLSSTMPKVGGDYVYNSRVVHPVFGFAGNLCSFVNSFLACGLAAVFLVSVGLAPALGIIGTVTGSEGWLDLSSTISTREWTFGIAAFGILLMSLLSALGTRVATRASAISYWIALVGFTISMGILLFTSRDSFVSTINDFSQPFTETSNTYQATIDGGREAGLTYPGDEGYSGRSTFGAIITGIGALMSVWWGIYMAGEMKAAGRRKRQLGAILMAGLGQGLIAIVAILILLNTIGYDFLAAASGGNYGVGVSPYFNYFASVVAGNDIVAILLGLSFVFAVLPLMFTQLAMCQRALFAWAFDGLIPERVATVHPRTHTPVVAIGVIAVASIGAAAWAAYADSFITVLSYIFVFAVPPILFTGISALLLPRLRPEIYQGSSAAWKVAGVPVLPVAAVGTIVLAVTEWVIIFYFNEELAITSRPVAVTILLGTFALAAVWYFVARSVQSSRGVDLSLAYKSIPPD